MAKRLNGRLVRPTFVLLAGIIALTIVYFLPNFFAWKIDGKATEVVLLRKSIRPSASQRIEKEIPPTQSRGIKRDPFLPPHMRLEERPSGVFYSGELGFSLSGIVWDPENPVAIIDDEVKHIGDVIDGKKILEIKKDRVIFGEGEARYTLTLWEQ